MPGYTLVPVDYQPDFGYSLVPVDYDPFAEDGATQQGQIQQPQTATQPAQPQPQTPGSAPPLPPIVPNGGQAPFVAQPQMAAQEDIPPDIRAEIRYIRSGEGFARKRWRDFDRECMRWSQMRSIAACVSLATQILRVYAVSWFTW